MPVCASDNTQSIEQDNFWSTIKNGGKLEPHQIGWIISGACTVVTVLITLFSVFTHLRHYHAPAEQRQIIRILYLPPVFGIISFFSYRYFRDYYYYELIQIIYEAVTISAFMLLIIEFVATTASDNNAENALARKDKKPLPFPFCCLRYRPTKVYFMYTIKWAVLQYVIFRPLVSIAGIVTNALGLYCESGGLDPHFAYVYLEAVDFVSISVALYGLFVFYLLTREELKGRRPLAKFLAIKLIVFATFYQSFVFTILEKTKTIKPTTYWTESNVANGLSALCLTVQMVFFSFFMMWAYPVSEYKTRGTGTTSMWRPIVDSLNYSDFVLEILSSLRFFVRYMLGRPDTRGNVSRSPSGAEEDTLMKDMARDENDTHFRPRPPVKKDFGQAFGLYDPTAYKKHNGAGGGGPILRRKTRDSTDQPFLPPPPQTRGSGDGEESLEMRPTAQNQNQSRTNPYMPPPPPSNTYATNPYTSQQVPISSPRPMGAGRTGAERDPRR